MWQTACGKVILFGEHAVVYGVPAIAAGIANAIKARAEKTEDKTFIEIPDWHMAFELGTAKNLVQETMTNILQALDIKGRHFKLLIEPSIPHASGLGASAAVAVASIRALASCFDIQIDDIRVNQIAYSCEVLAHGSPSGLDNTLATYGGLMCFQRHQDLPHFNKLECPSTLRLIVAHSGKQGYTAETVKRVAQARASNRAKYDAIFNEIQEIAHRAKAAITSNNTGLLGPLMDANQECLRQLDVSCLEIENVIEVAKLAGASGAKLTGSGDGGAVIVYGDKNLPHINEKLIETGFNSRIIELK